MKAGSWPPCGKGQIPAVAEFEPGTRADRNHIVFVQHRCTENSGFLYSVDAEPSKRRLS
jgi:hypothetical protein